MEGSIERPIVWTDPDLCTGCGCCGMIAPGIFKLIEPGVSVVHLNGVEAALSNGLTGRGLEPEECALAVQAAEECPGEIIFIESPKVEG